MTDIEALEWLMKSHARIAIAGVPKAGKTTLAQQVRGRTVLHTDDFMDRDWEDAPMAAASACPSGPVVIEGVRALATASKLRDPVTCVVWLDSPRVKLNGKQYAMAKGRRTNFEEWRAENPDVQVMYLGRDPEGR